MQTDDGRIIQDCLGGKPQAFGILVDKYKEGVYAYVYAELRDFHDAQDVTQDNEGRYTDRKIILLRQFIR